MPASIELVVCLRDCCCVGMACRRRVQRFHVLALHPWDLQRNDWCAVLLKNLACFEHIFDKSWKGVGVGGLQLSWHYRLI